MCTQISINDIAVVEGDSAKVLNVRNNQAYLIFEDGYSDWFDFSEIESVGPPDEDNDPDYFGSY